MSTHEKLLPCPFCGGEAKIHDIGNDLKKSRKTEIVCTQCHVKKVVAAIHNPLSWTRATAISAWNRRTPPAAVPDGWVMVPGNVRWVCFSVNLGMSDWGEEIYRKVCAEVVRHGRLVKRPRKIEKRPRKTQ